MLRVAPQRVACLASLRSFRLSRCSRLHSLRSARFLRDFIVSRSLGLVGSPRFARLRARINFINT
jgi:hypothetical protein